MARRDPVSLTRPLEATQIPSGQRVLLPQGAWVSVQQTLGGQFTAMTDRGGLVRIEGVDADALGPEYVEEARSERDRSAAAASGPFQEEKVWEALNTVYDPEIPASIVELGLVYLVASEPVDGGQRVIVRMTLTAPGCGVGPMLVDDVRRKVLGIAGVKEADVDLVFDPPWDPSRMSDAAKLHLGLM